MGKLTAEFLLRVNNSELPGEAHYFGKAVSETAIFEKGQIRI